MLGSIVGLPRIKKKWMLFCFELYDPLSLHDNGRLVLYINFLIKQTKYRKIMAFILFWMSYIGTGMEHNIFALKTLSQI